MCKHSLKECDFQDKPFIFPEQLFFLGFSLLSLHFMVSLLIWIIDFTLGFISAAIDTVNGSLWSSSETFRRHGRWKSKRAFPSHWIILSCIALSASQVSGFVDASLHQVSSTHPTTVPCYDGLTFSLKPIALRPPSFPRFWFYDPPSEIEDPFAPIEPDNADFVRAVVDPFTFVETQFLSTQGSVISDMWMEHMGKQSSLFSMSEVDIDVPDIDVKSENLTQIHSIGATSDEFLDTLVNLSREKVSLNTAASSNHWMDEAAVFKETFSRGRFTSTSRNSSDVTPME